MSNKDLESLYEKVLLKENFPLQQEETPLNDTSKLESGYTDEEHDILDDEDPLGEHHDDKPEKAVRELVAAVDHLIIRYQNVIDGQRTERDFFKQLEHLIPIIKGYLGKISL